MIGEKGRSARTPAPAPIPLDEMSTVQVDSFEIRGYLYVYPTIGAEYGPDMKGSVFPYIVSKRTYCCSPHAVAS